MGTTDREKAFNWISFNSSEMGESFDHNIFSIINKLNKQTTMKFTYSRFELRTVNSIKTRKITSISFSDYFVLREN